MLNLAATNPTRYVFSFFSEFICPNFEVHFINNYGDHGFIKETIWIWTKSLDNNNNSEKGCSGIYVSCRTFKKIYRLPGVIQFESKRFSVGRTSPRSFACFIKFSASLADLKNKINELKWKQSISSILVWTQSILKWYF